MKASTLYHDGRRILRALWLHRGQRHRAGRRDLGLAYLEVVEPVAVPGREATYRTAVTDLGPEPRPVELVLDFWLRSDGPPQHVGYMVAELITVPRSRAEIEMRWDGVHPGKARHEGVSLPCQTWFGAVNRPGVCDVDLILRCNADPVDDVRARQQRRAVPV